MNIRTPASRSTDPSSSYEAERRIDASGVRQVQQEQVREAMRKFTNCTSRELAVLAGLDRHMVARRLPEMEGVYVERGEQRRCRYGRGKATTWSLKDA